MRKKILFTGGGGAGTEAIWRYLGKKYDLYFADAVVESIDDVIPTSRKLLIPFADSADFVVRIQEICAREKIDLIVPGVDEELLPLCESRGEEVPEVFAPPAGFVRLMLDKLEAAKAIKRAGLSVPKTLPVERAAEIGFPLIVKPKSGRGSRGVCILESEEEVDAYKMLYRTSPNKLLAQELAVGIEYTVLVAGDKSGRLTAIVPVKVQQKKGITILAQTDLNPDIIEYAKKFHEVFKPHAVYNIQCILTSGGAVLPFEVNPRISTTFCLGLASGFDPFAEAQWEQRPECFLPENQLHLKRNWHNYISGMPSGN